MQGDKNTTSKIYKDIRQSRLCSALLEASSGRSTEGVPTYDQGGMRIGALFPLRRFGQVSSNSSHRLLSQTKRRRSDPVLWQKPLHQRKCQKDKVTTQSTPQKSAIKQLLRTDLGRSVGVTTATQLVWLTWFTGHLPTPRNSRVIKRTHI